MFTILAIIALSLPALGALVVWGLANRDSSTLPLVVVFCMAGSGVAGLGLLLWPDGGLAHRLLGPDYASFGDPGSLIVMIAVTAANLIAALAICVRYRRGLAQQDSYYAWLLLLFASLACMAVFRHPLLLLLSWNLLLFCTYKLMTYGGLVDQVRHDLRDHRDRQRYDLY